jgi:hypothetical protein
MKTARSFSIRDLQHCLCDGTVLPFAWTLPPVFYRGCGVGEYWTLNPETLDLMIYRLEGSACGAPPWNPAGQVSGALCFAGHFSGGVRVYKVSHSSTGLFLTFPKTSSKPFMISSFFLSLR